VEELARLVELAERVQVMLVERRLTLSSAESCTGGLFGHVVTEVPGSSDYYLGGIISYSDELKREQLEVDPLTIEKHGAVSAQTCVAMADGARRRYRSSMAVAVTGIAGPGGGSDSKPVGLTYIGLADENGHDVRRHAWQGDRHSNKVESVAACLELILERLSSA
jgi:PncC family amidohydrolase